MKKKIFRILAIVASLYNAISLQYLIWVPNLHVNEWPLNAVIDEGMFLLILTPFFIGAAIDD